MAEIIKTPDMQYRIAALNAAYVLSGESSSRTERELLDIMGNACLGKYGNMSEGAFYTALARLKDAQSLPIIYQSLPRYS